MQPQRYDPTKSYLWNYENAPAEPLQASPETARAAVDFLGLPVASRLGIAAGPLLNGRWVLHYAALGFDVLTYKTVRSRRRACYPLPNLVPVDDAAVTPGQVLAARETMAASWAISFGMPSMPPDVWREDVAWTKARLGAGQLLSVSVVATPQPDWSLAELADDYARCAAWAVESGADCVEVNFSCPNVCSSDGQLYQQPDSAAQVASVIRASIGRAPLIAKIGYVGDREQARRLVQSVDGIVDGLSMTNCISALVESRGQPLFDAQPRGIGGQAIHADSVAQVARFAECISSLGSTIRIVGVGGVSSVEHVRAYLSAGAHAVHVATAIMLDPQVGLRMRADLQTNGTSLDH